jgi:hypothetical protein
MSESRHAHLVAQQPNLILPGKQATLIGEPRPYLVAARGDVDGGAGHAVVPKPGPGDEVPAEGDGLGGSDGRHVALGLRERRHGDHVVSCSRRY